MVFCNNKLSTIELQGTMSHNPYFNRWFSAMINILTHYRVRSNVTILILIDGFLQFEIKTLINNTIKVTILILIDGFLQYEIAGHEVCSDERHNPYFNRWFSAIRKI